MKKQKWQYLCLILVLLLILLLGPWSPLASWHQLEYEFDVSKSYGLLPLFADVTSGYSSVQSERAEYTTEDEICLIISGGFFPNAEQAQLVREIRMYAEENPVFDIRIEINEEQNIRKDTSSSDSAAQEQCWILTVPCDTFTAEDLVYKKGLLGQTQQSSLNFTFTAYLTVKEDAPENWKGLIQIEAYADAGTDSYGNLVSGQFIVDYCYCEKDGDTIRFTTS